MDTARHVVSARIRVEPRLDDAGHIILGDALRLRSAFLNLVLNARDAMPEGGALGVATRVVEVRPDDGAGLRPGRYAAVSVSDTGVGMDEATLGRIFEPFFTTRETGGLGPGLGGVRECARAHGGMVRVRSREGEGTTFEVLLPLLK